MILPCESPVKIFSVPLGSNPFRVPRRGTLAGRDRVSLTASMKITEKDKERFWKRVNRNGPIPPHMPHLGNCWVWTGARGGKAQAYGRFYLNSTKAFAHRLAVNAPKGLKACHRCDNGLCVRPSHIFVGTQADNLADMVSKKRRHKFEAVFQNPSPSNNKKSEFGRASLTEEQAEMARNCPRKYGAVAAMARAFGVSRGAIWHIREGNARRKE
jgi:HNH endonuclease